MSYVYWGSSRLQNKVDGILPSIGARLSTALDSQARPVSSSPILVFKLNWEFEYGCDITVVINTYMVF